MSVARTTSMRPDLMTLYTSLSRLARMLTLLSDWVSLKPRAEWWFSRTVVSLYRMASSLPLLQRKALLRPG